MKYGLVTLIRYIARNKARQQIWLGRCECGTIEEFKLNALQTGNTKSCGCLNLRRIRERNTTHGMSKTNEYLCWKNIKFRCYNPKCQKWEYYGGRGIKMCQRWRNSFEAFINDMGRMPSKSHTIDRIDSDGDYTPKNCRWITKAENVARRNHAQSKV